MDRKFRNPNWILQWIVGLTVLANPNLVQADWDPQEFLIDLGPASFNCLIDKDFESLKINIINTLKDSWCSKEKINLLMDLVFLTKPKVCVEIGAFTGSSVLPVAVTLKLLNHGRIYAIDAWSNEEAVKYLEANDPNRQWWSKVDMTEVRRTFNKMLTTWHINSFCSTISETSEKAIKHMPEIDFLHLDGDYSEIISSRDVKLYLPKVKSGGYVLLSNLFIVANGMQTKLNSFLDLFDSCELICDIENSNAVLLKKL